MTLCLFFSHLSAVYHSTVIFVLLFVKHFIISMCIYWAGVFYYARYFPDYILDYIAD